MKELVKGSPISSGGRTSAQEVGTGDRHAVGLFRGGAFLGETHLAVIARYQEHSSFPPRTVILLTPEAP